MADEREILVVLSTVPSESVGRDIARNLLTGGLAACVNIVPGVVSIYEWDGRMEESSEAILVIKTTTDKVDALIGSMAKLHPYDVPEIIALPVQNGYKPYIDWIKSVVSMPSCKEISKE
jgi:periplasmic divalent cation tolerance protein